MAETVIKQVEKNNKEIRQNSSLQTIFTLINLMIGGTILILPSLTLQKGIIITPLVLIITGGISYKTCSIYNSLMKEDEIDVQYPIKRILGKNWLPNGYIPCKITDFFSVDPDNWAPFIVSCLYLLMLISVLPVYWDVTKRRISPFLGNGSETISQKNNLIMNTFFILFGIGIKIIPDITADQIASFNGSLTIFFFVYLIPIIMHFVTFNKVNKFLLAIKILFLKICDPIQDTDKNDTKTQNTSFLSENDQPNNIQTQNSDQFMKYLKLSSQN
ncbi:hypothetical protein PPERSA_01023 [Pseudocohnilembus persalinus]|uniref:Uncharacterized protein n=1 Tax=Pseudocohnilembus persalinus TaxID=266149 RepID=A0A0V0QU71_PSEPJ|nr:hypothetical protein PPERSA_01023 [Pseudocohnilembus persalinus]|eukprot:KRX05945.1 hypothetical protein PPERSA_01023 [Pseudocohnilembus persalinus]